ncbi:MAG: RNA-binding protein [Bacteroidales bacterium]|nr:RNA-binding protein [Bacteroidales bacterium]
MNIFVANLDYRIQKEDLIQLFEKYGEVYTARIISDKNTGRSKGYGFVEMRDERRALTAIEELDGKEIAGREIVVKMANSGNDNYDIS